METASFQAEAFLQSVQSKPSGWRSVACGRHQPNSIDPSEFFYSARPQWHFMDQFFGHK